jgi:serine/threonine-protein kinase HipA
MSKRIGVYADWEGLREPLRLGTLFAQSGRGREVFEFEYATGVITHPALANARLDPRIGPFPGRQQASPASGRFGMFADASPDRWGRVLMQRRLERDQRSGRAPRSARLLESDYLLGVHDAYRVGGLRFRLDDTGPFLDDRHDEAAPPFVRLRELEAASLALERDERNVAPEGDAWLRMLIAPGGSLGGARPKASVVDKSGQLWIAKFPGARDAHDVGAWEAVVHSLAAGCGLAVPEGLSRRFTPAGYTFLVRRFDRTNAGRRVHFASAMTLTGREDGDDASTGASYLDLARVLIDHGERTAADLTELWSRIAFNMLVSNTDDHLRNHGFLLVPGKGWRLAPAFDMNPEADAGGLRLNVSESDNALDLELALAVAPQFRVRASAAAAIVDRLRTVVRQWPEVAARMRIPVRERERMQPAFRLSQ